MGLTCQTKHLFCSRKYSPCRLDNETGPVLDSTVLQDYVKDLPARHLTPEPDTGVCVCVSLTKHAHSQPMVFTPQGTLQSGFCLSTLVTQASQLQQRMQAVTQRPDFAAYMSRRDLV